MIKAAGLFVLLAALTSLAVALAAPEKPAKKDPPKVIVAIPLGVAPGATTKVTIRGMKLDKATAIRFQNAKITGKILSKGNAPVPDKDPDKVGNTQITVDVVVPAGLPGEPIGFVVVTSEGETLPRRLLLESTLPVTREKEPNDGFPQAQKIRIPHVVEGVIDRPRDVDVFQFEGKAGQKIDCEVLAARYGSPLDSILTLYDGKGREIASNDDMEATTDSRLIVTLPNTGAYYLTLIDANDSGSFIHVYRLVVKESR